MKNFRLLNPPRLVSWFRIFAFGLSGFLMLHACRQDKTLTSSPPLDETGALALRSPMADLADSIFQNEDFQAILEDQVWVNAKVEEYMTTADSITKAVAKKIILSWTDTGYLFSNQDTGLVKEVLGFPDEESFHGFATELGNHQEALVDVFSTSLSALDTAELGELLTFLSARAIGSVQGDSLIHEGSLEIEFRRADCCCTRPNQCSWAVCTEYDNCVQHAWEFYGSSVIAISLGAGGVGGFPGAAIGFSASATFGAVYLGYSISRCEQNANEGCALCGCN